MKEKEEFALKVISEYICKNGVSIPVEFHFVDNINDSWKNYVKGEKVIEQFSNADFSEYNGLLLPFDGVQYHILIKNDYIDYKCTIIHESTHVIDYDDFRVLFNNGEKDIEMHQFYWYMALYSEFHARSIAHSYYFQHLQSTQDLEQVIFEELINIVSIIQEIENQIKNAKSEKIRQNLYYDLMQYLGRISTTKIDISPLDAFSDKIKNPYSCLIALDLEWSDYRFQNLKLALKQLSY